jgi:hypothetical protein
MISGNRQKIKNDTTDGSRTSGASPLFKLSATMVELSLRHKPPESRAHTPATVVPKVVPITVEPRLPEAKEGRVKAGTSEEEENATQVLHNGTVQAWREHFQTSIFRISSRGIKLFALLPNRTIFAALALLAFLSVYALRHKADSVKSQSQVPASVTQQVLVPIPSQNTPNHRQTAAKKAKPRRRPSDYVAKDTYIYYGKDGKPDR